jgi:ABC-type multidrug transport system ATPase subunit
MADNVQIAPELIVCPQCHYAFPDTHPESSTFTCRRNGCGYRWEALTETVRAVHGAARRVPQPELSVVSGASRRRLELPEGETIIGRDADCQFVIDNRTASRRHARILRRGDEVTLEDLNSSCGTTLNGRVLDGPAKLKACDEIIIGGSTLEFAVRYVAASEAPQIADHSSLIERVAQVISPRLHGKSVEIIPLASGLMTIGRDPDRDITLPDPMVSARHATIERSDAGCFLSDAQSAIGTFVNGKGIIRAKLEPGDRVQFGPFLFRFDGDRLVRILQPASFGLEARDVTKTIGTTTILDGVTVSFQPSEFVGLLGPSGAGKTTLLDALNGLRPATSGQVLINGEPLYEQYDRLRHHIGYVPQDDIIHRELTVRQALTHAARLRLPSDVTDHELERAVDETLETLQMSHRADVLISHLSGGQRKRVSVGVELLSRPGILFLDEPTSGLDPGTESHLMRLFRRLADQRRTVVCTTHVMENVDLFHKLVILAPGGKLAYFGPPGGVKAHFGIERFTDLYDRMSEKPPEEWRRLYQDTPLCRELIGGPSYSKLATTSKPRRKLDPPRISRWGQWRALMRRNLDLLRADKQNLALLILQPLLITGLICLVCSELPTILFLLIISALWFGCSNAAQQLVKERPIYRRERMVNLRLDTYLMSKFLPLAVIGAVQAGLMLGLVYLAEDEVRRFGAVVLATLLCTWCGAAMGLIISAVAANPDKAMSIVPLSLIPQIILAGVLVPVPKMNDATRFLTYPVIAYWGNQACELGYLQGATLDADLLADPVSLRPVANLFPDDDLDDPAAQLEFLSKHDGERIDRRDWLRTDLGVLAGFIIGQLLVTTFILRRQDVL